MQISLEQAAEELGVAIPTLQRWLRQGVIPHLGGEDEPLFEREMLRSWASRVHLSFQQPEEAAPASDNFFQAALRRGGVLRLKEVSNQLEAFSQGLAGLEGCLDKDLLLKLLLERERIGTTAMGNGVALPHPQNPARLRLEAPIVRIIYLEEPLDLGARDGIPVHTLMVLLANDASAHLKLLSQAARSLLKPEFAIGIAAQPELDGLIALFRGEF